MTMATETENNGPESKEIKDVKEMKEALKDETPPDNKQEEKDAAKKEEAGKKEETADAAGAGGGTAASAASSAPAKPVTVHKTNYEKDVVYLYQFFRTALLPSISPYCLKVETWLRLNGIKYELPSSSSSSSLLKDNGVDHLARSRTADRWILPALKLPIPRRRVSTG
ncbi:hypothetical protein HZH68_006197 [Vespula germanica]|uniref:Uncharacterized protein n=1 Tax=Vespula germanica TaxID=30212 RepID=A0A834KAZ0_VESGE|nr:hypothetical protein HZH68_006197 [Vespula germanica]